MEVDKNKKMLENASFGELLLKLALPAVIVIVIMIIYNIADTYFIGQTQDPNKIAAISLSMPVFTILSGIGTLFGNGGTTALSIAYGEGNQEKIKSISAFCFQGALLTGCLALVLIFLFTEPIALILGADADTLALTVTYLKIFCFASPFVLLSQGFGSLVRADGDAALAMIASLAGTILNIVLDALFILVFHWDIVGAALATVIGNVVNLLILVIIIFRKKQILIPEKSNFIFQPKIAISVISLGLPMACSTILSSISSTIQNRMMISYSPIALAAQGVAGKVGMVVTMLLMGVCMGLQPAISYNYGARNIKRMKQIVRDTGGFTVILGIILSVLAFAFKDGIVAAFIDNQEVIAYGRVFVLAAVIVGPFYAMYQLCQTFMQSTGKASYAIFTSLLDKGLIFVPVLWVMNQVFGIYGIAFSHAVTMVFSLLVGVLLSIRWAKTIIKDFQVSKDETGSEETPQNA